MNTAEDKLFRAILKTLKDNPDLVEEIQRNQKEEAPCVTEKEARYYQEMIIQGLSKWGKSTKLNETLVTMRIQPNWVKEVLFFLVKASDGYYIICVINDERSESYTVFYTKKVAKTTEEWDEETMYKGCDKFTDIVLEVESLLKSEAELLNWS
ncbi:hypothetical protein [Mechercharimyces sp. CAU 1602]|uniref:hypothetical protein n=1 Tax=Mechercharimyces sp. CAU 1602 TaxID=2973933 RepID=UPI0021626CE4|nr:hypothetical protein [Mechercharimyces sp. CAU 1602]MCS1352820.1 hypothetical protein [Mechercharimyces sp. CAU 1602]